MNLERSKGFEIVVVQGVRYGVVKQLKIKNHLFAMLLSEWGKEAFNKEWYPEMDSWDWTVETLKVSEIKLWKPLLEDLAFTSSLEERVKVQTNRILQGEVIEPVVVRGRDMVIYDGYARLHALKHLKKSKVLAYVGR